MKEAIRAIIKESADLKAQMVNDDALCSAIAEATVLLTNVTRQSGTVYICGNGGSACDSMHFCEELVARYKRERPGMRAMHFMDAGTLSCWANDYNFSTVFKRQVETFCTSKDVLVCFTTSGNSGNILEAMKAAKAVGCPVILLTGRDGGQALRLATHPIVIPAWATERIQEAHITIVHAFCEMLEAPPA
jgi:D-sedoheptulose 7-phosphate isomerase